MSHPDGKARVYFDNGRVVHAEFNDLVGDDAVYTLFSDERGSFEFQVGVPAPEITVESSTENLLLEAIRKLDESNRDSSSIPDDMVPLFVEEDSGAAKLTLQEKELSFLEHVNGQNSLQDLALKSGVALEEIKQIADRLVRAGVLKLLERKPRTARLVTRLVRSKLPTGSVGLDSNILANWERVLGEIPQHVLCRKPDGNVQSYSVQSMEKVGPYILFSMETLAVSNLAVDVALLVKPVLQ